MHQISIFSLSIILFILICCSAFFSGSETGLMSINRYRLKHKAKTSKKARRVSTLLARPDKLLGVILIGNNFVNISASAIATLIGLKVLGDAGVLVSTIMLTVVILIFGEITPKTLAALKPESVSYLAARPLQFLLIILYPFVWLANTFTHFILRLFGIKQTTKLLEPLTREELHTVVKEANTLLPSQHQSMLLGILELSQVTVDDIMIPRNDVIGINIEDEAHIIQTDLAKTQHTLQPIYEHDFDNIKGIVHLKDITNLFAKNDFNKAALLQVAQKPYYIPEGTHLHDQLKKFKQEKNRMGLVVDEYGDFLGLVTLEDILEEIVGEFTTDTPESQREVHPQKDGSYIIDGGISVRDLNRDLKWHLPTAPAKTLSGLIIEYLETMPIEQTCVCIQGYPIEILSVQDNMVDTAQIFPRLPNKQRK